ncbi:MAG: hypothetical protein CVU46_06545 [Chloroflexi bacterium HGW-Chloroflexi-8]|nr:MAG: hypothetical protein CVU46_06545 [Chloroflexi bacterium HGW-Chloroflexi-8]
MSVSSNQEVSKFRSKIKLYVKWLIPIGIFIFFVIIYYLNSRHIWNIVSQKQNIIFGSDTMDTLDNLKELTFEVDTKKRLLFSVTLTPISKSIQKVLGLSQNKSIRLTLAILAALNITGVYLFLKKYSSSTIESLLFTGFYSFFYSNFVIFSIPETYSMSNLFILIYIATLFVLLKSSTVYSCMLLSVITGAASLYNPVLLSLVIIPIVMVFIQSDRKRWAIISLSNFAIGVFIYYFANYLLFRENPFVVLNYYANSYASLNNLLDIKSIAGVFSNFYFFSILSPHHYMSANLGLIDWLGYGNFIFGPVVILLVGIFLIYGIYVLFARKIQKEAFLLSLLMWTVLLSLFYTYFNPKEAILYSSQILFPLIIIFLHAFRTIKWRLSTKFIVFSICLLFIAFNNISAFFLGVR